MTEEVKVNPIDSKELWRAEVYTDRKNGTINVMLPVDVYGQRDLTRKPIYQSVVGVNVGRGQEQLGFVIEAVTLREAVDGWESAAILAIRGAIQEAERMAFANKLAMPSGMAARVN